ncbi:hypothetical protein CsSME_00007066 [Camellia sinensis var. sinensis]
MPYGCPFMAHRNTFTLLLFIGLLLTIYIMYVGEQARDQA